MEDKRKYELLDLLSSNGNFDDSAKIILAALKENKINSEDVSEAIRTLIRRGRFENAEKMLTTILENHLFEESFFILLTDVLRKDKRSKEAFQWCAKGVETFPDSKEILFAKALSAIDLREYEDSEKCLRRAIEIEPNDFKLQFYLGNALRCLEKFTEAEKEYLRALEINPSSDETFYNLGVVAEKKNEFSKAIDCYAKAVELNQENYDAHWNKALLLLTDKNFEEGWKWFERRLKKRQFQRNDLPFPYWDGTSLNGKRLLLYDEQGFGDAIQFLRFVKYLKNENAQIVCECKKELTTLFEESGLFDAVFERGSRKFVKDEFDRKASLLSLPFLLKADKEKIQIAKPYLKPKKTNEVKPAIGLVWQGNPKHQNDKYRSISPDKLFAALGSSGAELVSLQTGELSENVRRLMSDYGIKNVGENFADFQDAADFISSIDLVITVDTASAHLSGALMKETRLLLPANPDWRWGREGSETEWYPTMKLFRQKKIGDWENVLLDLQAELKKRFEKTDGITDKSYSVIYQEAIDNFENGNYAKAAELFSEAVKIKANDSSLWNNLGLSLSANGQFGEAESAFEKSIEIDNDYVEAYNNYAINLFNAGETEKAKNVLKRALEIGQNNFKTIFNLANLYHRTGEIDFAESHYRKALELNPANAEIYYNLSLIFLEKKMLDNVAEIIDEWIMNLGESEKLFFVKGNLEKEKENFDDAEASYLQAIMLAQDYKDAWLNLAQIYYLTGKYSEALELYLNLEKQTPNDSRIYYSVGVVYQELKELPNSETYLRKAVKISPEKSEYRFALSETLLSQGFYEEGFSEYEWRLKREEYSGYQFVLPRELSEIEGKNVLIIDEQGAGDTINFLRYVKEISKSATVDFAAKQNMVNLLSEQKFIRSVFPLEQNISNQYDFVIPIASLPKYFVEEGNLFYSEGKYIATGKEVSVDELENSEGFKIGIVWKGNRYPVHNRKRHIEIETFAELFLTEGVTFFSFQKELTIDEELTLASYPNIIDLSGYLNDFSDTLALLKKMDLVISIDTAVAHLAGAAGMKTWLLLPFAPDWRWKTEGEKTEWYQSVVCFRQPNAGNWNDVINSVKEKLSSPNNKGDEAIEEAIALMNKGEYAAAINSLTNVVENNPANIEALNLLAANYSAVGDFENAEIFLRRLLEVDEQNANALINLGVILFNRNEFEKSFGMFETALFAAPDNYAAHFNYAVALEASAHFERAIDEYVQAAELAPDNYNVKNNLAMSLLRLKYYPEGWELFENRFFTGELKRNEMPGERWNGEIEKDKTLYVYSDQGYGDAIQFSRFIQAAKERVGKIIFEVQSELLPLFNNFEGIDKSVATKPNFSTQEVYDCQIPLLSLPFALQAENEFSEIGFPYFKIEKEKEEKWGKIISGDKKIGIAWRGNPVFARNYMRSTSLENFLALTGKIDATFYSLQKEITNDEEKILSGSGIKNIGAMFNDFADSAAAISNLDLIITTDTIIPHLAGALGKETYLLLSFVPDWRWGVEEEISSWYPSVKLIRQKQIGDWASVFDELERRLG